MRGGERKKGKKKKKERVGASKCQPNFLQEIN
jgi:hypothetical protein